MPNKTTIDNIWFGVIVEFTPSRMGWGKECHETRFEYQPP